MSHMTLDNKLIVLSLYNYAETTRMCVWMELLSQQLAFPVAQMEH